MVSLYFRCTCLSLHLCLSTDGLGLCLETKPQWQLSLAETSYIQLAIASTNPEQAGQAYRLWLQ